MEGDDGELYALGGSILSLALEKMHDPGKRKAMMQAKRDEQIAEAKKRTAECTGSY